MATTRVWLKLTKEFHKNRTETSTKAFSINDLLALPLPRHQLHYHRVDSPSRAQVVAAATPDLLKTGRGIEFAGGSIVRSHLEGDFIGTENRAACDQGVDQGAAETQSSGLRAQGQSQEFRLLGGDPAQGKAEGRPTRLDDQCQRAWHGKEFAQGFGAPDLGSGLRLEGGAVQGRQNLHVEGTGAAKPRPNGGVSVGV